MRLEGKTALITGASRGIGRAIAVRFAAEGALVGVNYRSNEAAARETAELIAEAAGEALLLQADVTDAHQVDGMFETCIGEFGRLDILVNNVSTEVRKSLWDTEPEEWDFVQCGTLRSVFLCSRRAALHMMPRGSGKILNMSSIHDSIPRLNAAAYCAAKAGVLMLTRACALELAPYNIQVNAISPGLIETDRTRGYVRHGNRDGLSNIQTAIPARRAGTPEEIAEPAVYLVSDASGYTTGTTIYIDGGYLQTTCRIP
jgi:NAD(P)-dependent dehydrogenase (short-subunit alcohol dehydrogenase family)